MVKKCHILDFSHAITWPISNMTTFSWIRIKFHIFCAICQKNPMTPWITLVMTHDPKGRSKSPLNSRVCDQIKFLKLYFKQAIYRSLKSKLYLATFWYLYVFQLLDSYSGRDSVIVFFYLTFVSFIEYWRQVTL